MGNHVERKVVNWKCIHNMWIELITKDDIETYIKQEVTVRTGFIWLKQEAANLHPM